MDKTQHNSSLVDYTKSGIMTDLKEKFSSHVQEFYTLPLGCMLIYLLFSQQRCQYLGPYAKYVYTQMVS